LVAYLKPTKDEPNHPRAAYEKIASDLAYEVELSVPPVVLYVRPDPQPGQAKEVALSLLVASQVFPWGELFDFGTLDGGLGAKRALHQILKFVFSVGAGLVAFDAWLGNTDRNNPNNVILAREENTLGTLYFLDFSNSMDFNGGWSGGNDLVFSTVGLPPAFAMSLDGDRVREGAERISSIPDSKVREIVTRIPDDFLAPDRRGALSDNLVARKAILLEEFPRWYPGP
jgi:hypothetical protein